ncbi:MAG: hypothetical protein C5B54_05880 [Acidobacteria bacterium]|nr:MAG: hypothetical protein C5B54_05880 [Acidobacteriota bacterium]
MKKRILIVLAILLFIAWFLWQRKPTFETLRGNTRYNVLIVTLDTTRADRIGAYGFTGIKTPNIDSLAANGILFEKCISPTPLTFPAHTSIFTGTYPLFHGVRDNAAFVVPQSLTTLAEVFRKHGYTTAAFVSSFVLDSQWGLNQGFDYYYDNFDLHRENVVSVGDIQRPGNETADAALKWLSNNTKNPFLLWVHFYDPHTPYEPPPPFKELYAENPYLGEIAFADAQIGRLLQKLTDSGLRDKTFILVAGDHGESLGQHKEDSHGFFIYQESLHVPFIISTPFKEFRKVRNTSVVSLVDLMPTILSMEGFHDEGLAFQGHNLVDDFKNNAKTPTGVFAYSETFYPRFHFGWSELQAIQDDDYKLILSSEPELYDLQKDSGETTNLFQTNRNKSSEYEQKAKQVIAHWSKNAQTQDYKQVDEETQDKLSALGYIGTFQNTKGSETLPAPREKVDLYRQLNAARELSFESDDKTAERLIQEVIAKDPGIIDAYSALGNIYLKQRRYSEAEQYYQKALNIKPNDPSLIMGVAGCKLANGQTDQAETFLLDSLKVLPSDSRIYFLLGNIYRKKNDEARAIDAYNHCLTLNPKSASAHNALAAIYYIRKDFASARQHVQSALSDDARLPGIHYTDAQLLEHDGRLEEATAEYKKELQISNRNFRAAYNLSAVYRQLGNSAEEERYLREAIDFNPDFPLSYLYLARIDLQSGHDYEKAIDLVQKSLNLKPEDKYRALAYFLLADLYNRTGNEKLSREFASKGEQLKQH